MAQQMRSILEQALHHAGISAPLARRLPKQVWEAAVGREIATRAQPTVLSAGVLFVLDEDHRWRDQLDAMRTDLIARLNARLGKVQVRELRFGLAHAGALPSHASFARGDNAASSDAPDRAQSGPAREVPEHLRCAAKLSPELREIFLRAGHAASARAAQTRVEAR